MIELWKCFCRSKETLLGLFKISVGQKLHDLLQYWTIKSSRHWLLLWTVWTVTYFERALFCPKKFGITRCRSHWFLSLLSIMTFAPWGKILPKKLRLSMRCENYLFTWARDKARHGCWVNTLSMFAICLLYSFLSGPVKLVGSTFNIAWLNWEIRTAC